MGRASITASTITGTLVLLSVVGCGEDPPPPPKTPVAATASAKPAPKPVVIKQPTKEIAQRFPFGANDEVTTLIYSDLSPLKSPDAQKAVANGASAFASEIGGVDRACVDAIASTAKELLVGGGKKGWVAVLSVPDAKLDAVCNPSPKTGADAKIEGASKSWRYAEPGRVCAFTPGWLACGDPDLVKQALAATGEPTVPVELRDEQFVTIDDRDPVKDFKLTGAAFPDHLETRIEIAYDTEDNARSLHEEMAHAKEMVPLLSKAMKAPPAQQKLMVDIANQLVVSHRGPLATMRVDWNGSPQEQASDLGTFGAILGTGMILERTEHRKAAARELVRSVSESLAKAWEEPKGPYAKHDRLPAFPAVPKTVPKGERVVPPADAWKGWEGLKYTPSPDGSFFQIEVKPAKDGQSADIIAHGDLNGDGKTSSFVQHVKIDPSSKQLMVEPKLDITDAEE